MSQSKNLLTHLKWEVMKRLPDNKLLSLARLMKLSHCPECQRSRAQIPLQINDSGTCFSCHTFRTEILRRMGQRTIAEHASVLSNNGMSTKIDLYIERLTD